MTRTHDLLITNQLLYRLSYISIFTFGVADLILTNQLLYQLSYTSICNWNSPETLISAIAMIAHFSASVNLFSQENGLFLLSNRDNTNCILWIFRSF